jgi:uncharacterized protein
MTSAASPSASDISLQRCPHLYLLKTPAKGRGVFTSRPIASGTLIDACPVLILDPHENREHIEHTSLYHYTYNWPTPNGKTQAVVFGLGSMFNHSSRNQNVGWTRDLENEVVIYRALRHIAAGEELCISYGDHLTFVDADAAEEEEESNESADEVLDKIQVDL